MLDWLFGRGAEKKPEPGQSGLNQFTRGYSRFGDPSFKQKEGEIASRFISVARGLLNEQQLDNVYHGSFDLHKYSRDGGPWCYTRNFIDPDPVMAQAFLEVIGRSVSTSPADKELWNCAFSCAQYWQFRFLPSVEERRGQEADIAHALARSHGQGIDMGETGERGRWLDTRRAEMTKILNAN